MALSDLDNTADRVDALPADVLAEVERIVASTPAPTATQVERLRAMFPAPRQADVLSPLPASSAWSLLGRAA